MSAASAIFTRCFVSGQQRSLISSGCNIGRFVYFFDWDTRLIRQPFAGLKFRRGLDNLAVQLADLNRHLAEGRLDRLEFALKLAAVANVSPHAKSASLAHGQFRELVRC